MQTTSRSVTQGRMRPTGENSRHPPALAADPPVADHVNPTVDLMELAPLELATDLPSSQAKREQLPPRHHSMLPQRQGTNRGLYRSIRRFDTHSVLK